MAKRIGTRTIALDNSPTVFGAASVVGTKEGKSTLGKSFDIVLDDDLCGQESWELAESAILRRALATALQKTMIPPTDIDVVLAGDLLNQCISTTFGLKTFDIPMLGIYGACSTFAEALLLGGLLVDSGAARRAAAAASSHFSSAERQFRFPLSYGSQRTPTSQWTVTGAGAAILTECCDPPYIREVTPGRIVDLEVTDANNMGAAMAPAAADTILAYLRDTGHKPMDFDYIVTGDLGKVGSALLYELLERENTDITRCHRDCGILLFDDKEQDTHAGGSGCGCSASVMSALFIPSMQRGETKELLFIATGALMSPTASQQGCSIPGIAHLVHLSASVSNNN